MTDDLEPTTIKPPDPSGTVPDAVDASVPERAPDVRAPQVQTTAVLPSAGRQRWMIAAGVVAVLVVLSAVAFSLFTGRAASAIVLGYVPADSIVYGEIRMDLPGDQRANVGSFLSKFPGFADQSTIETKIDEVLDRLVGGATGGEQAFSSDIKPWYGGELAFSVGALPDPSATESPDTADMGGARAIVLVSVKDEAAATAWLDGVVTDSGTTVTSESYNGANLLTFEENGEQGAYAVLNGKVLVVGDTTSVKAAVDTGGAGGFGSDTNVSSALQATSGDHVGFVYVALRRILDWSATIGGSSVFGQDPGVLTKLVPDWTAFALRVEGDGLVMESLAPKTEANDIGASRTSPVADHVPANAIALAISDDYGKAVLKLLDTYRSIPEFKSAVDSIDQALGVLGGPEAAAGWIGDIGIAVTKTDDGVDGGIVIVPTDRAAAERLFTSLRTLVSLGGSSAGITLRDETYAGQTITIVDLGDIGDLAALGGMSTDELGADLPAGHVELAYAITDQVVVLGSGPGFVRQVLDTTTATSIASNERYKSLVGRVGQGAGTGFLDLAAIRGLIEGAVGSMGLTDMTEYEQEYQPFLEPFDALITSTSVKDGLLHTKTIVTIK